MTQDLTTQVKTHVIITYTKSHHFITARQRDALVNLSSDQFIEIDGNQIRGSSIAEVMTVEKYRETYPEKIPTHYGQPYSPNYEVPLPNVYKTLEQKMNERKSFLEAGLRGLKKAQSSLQASGRPTPNCDKLIADVEKKILTFNKTETQS